MITSVMMVSLVGACSYFLWKWLQALSFGRNLEAEVKRLREQMLKMREDYEEERKEILDKCKVPKSAAIDIIRRVRSSKVE